MPFANWDEDFRSMSADDERRLDYLDEDPALLLALYERITNDNRQFSYNHGKIRTNIDELWLEAIDTKTKQNQQNQSEDTTR
jgi:hypothetical protein